MSKGEVPHTHPVERPKPWRIAGALVGLLVVALAWAFYLGSERGKEIETTRRQRTASNEDTFLNREPAVEKEEKREVSFLERLQKKSGEVEAARNAREDVERASPARDPFAERERQELARREMERASLLEEVGRSSMVVYSSDGRGGKRQREEVAATGRGGALEDRLGPLREQMTALREMQGALTSHPESKAPRGAEGTNAEGFMARSRTDRVRASGVEGIAAGTALRAVLVTGVNSEVPGTVLARTTHDVFNATVSEVILPRGTVLIGRNERAVAVGEKRMVLAWTRLDLPDGRSFDLPGLEGADLTGEAGVRSSVNNHYGQVYGQAVLLSLIGAGFQLSQPETSNSDRLSSREIVAAEVGRELSQVSTEILRRGLSIRPTLRLRAGHEFVVLLNRDLVLED